MPGAALALVDPLEHEVVRRLVRDGQHRRAPATASASRSQVSPVASVVKNSGGAPRVGLGEHPPAVVEVHRVRDRDVAAAHRGRADDRRAERPLEHRAAARRPSRAEPRDRRSTGAGPDTVRRMFELGLHEVADGVWAYLQPDGPGATAMPGWSPATATSLLVDTLFDLQLTRDMLDAMRARHRDATRSTPS